MMKEEISDIRKLLVTTEILLRKQEYQKAIEKYMMLDEKWKAVSQENKIDEVKTSIHQLAQRMMITLMVEESYINACAGDINAFRHSLDCMYHGSWKRITTANQLFSYTKKKMKSHLDYRPYKHSLQEFEGKCKSVREALEQRDIHEALKGYSYILLAYNVLRQREQEKIAYYYYLRLKDLLRQMTIQHVLCNAYRSKGRISLKNIE